MSGRQHRLAPLLGSLSGWLFSTVNHHSISTTARVWIRVRPAVFVREGDSVTYVIDIGVGYVPLSEVVIDLPVPRGFTVTSVPEYCGDRSFVDEIGLLCRVGDVEPDRYFTRPVTMIAGPGLGSEAVLPVAVVVSADGGAVRVRSGEVLVRVSAPAGVCDPHGIPFTDGAPSPSGPVVAGRANYRGGHFRCGGFCADRGGGPVWSRDCSVGDTGRRVFLLRRTSTGNVSPHRRRTSAGADRTGARGDGCERGDVLSTGTRIREESIGAHRLIVACAFREIVGGSRA